MTAAEIVAAVGAILSAIKEAPELVAAVENVFTTAGHGHDTTPALKHLEAVAAAKELGIPYP